MTVSDSLWDVIAIDLITHNARLMASAKSEADADAIVKMAVMRRGVETEIFKAVKHVRGQAETK